MELFLQDILSRSQTSIICRAPPNKAMHTLCALFQQVVSIALEAVYRSSPTSNVLSEDPERTAMITRSASSQLGGEKKKTTKQ